MIDSHRCQVPGRLFPIALEYIAPEDSCADSEATGGSLPVYASRREDVGGLATSRLPGAKPKPMDTKPFVRLLERIDREVVPNSESRSETQREELIFRTY